MAPTHAAAYCCARRGCGGYRFVHLAVANNEPLECRKCGDRFPKRTHLMPQPRVRNDVQKAATNLNKGGTGKGKGKDKGKGSGDNGNAKGGEKGGHAQARAKPKAKAKAASGPTPAPWAKEPTPRESIWIDPRRKEDPVYCATLQALVADKCNRPDRAAAAREELAAERAKYESELPPDKRLITLKKRLRAAEAAESKQEVRVRSAEQALVSANAALQEARAGLRDRKREVGEIKGAIEATELQIPPQPEALRPGLQNTAVKKPLGIPELIEMLFQAFKPYNLGENRAHSLEASLRNLECMMGNLEREQAERDAIESARDMKPPPNKRGRSSEETADKEDEMQDAAVGDLIAPLSPTPVAEEDDETSLAEAERAATTLAEAGVGSEAEIQSAAAAAARSEAAQTPARGASEDHALPAAGGTATPADADRSSRERSPRREPQREAPAGRVRWADQDVEEETPQLTAAQSAAIRGDDAGGGSLDSLPQLEEDSALRQASNQRGGGSLT